MNGAEIIVNTLIEQGVDCVFGYPGGYVIKIYDELYKASSRIKHYLTCHEQGATHAADGYARATGKTGVVIATSGPGATNLVTGIATAYLDSTPLVAITGNVAIPQIGRDSFQEVDIFGVTMPITKHNFLVKDISKLADTLRTAFQIANEGRPGPVLVDIPKDIQVMEYGFEEKSRYTAERETNVTEASIAEAAQIIKDAKKPFLYIGGGVVASDAGKEIIEFAEMIDAPIGSTMMGLTAVPNHLPYYLGMTGMHGRFAATKMMYAADVIIAVGVRFSDRATGNIDAYTRGRKIIHIDIDPAEVGKNIQAYAALIGDVKEVMQMLIAASDKQTRPDWVKEVASIKASKYNNVKMSDSHLNPQYIVEEVNRQVEDDTLIATDVGQHQMWASQYYNFSLPRTFLTSGGLGTMGFGMGASIGGCIGSDKRRTVLFTGDGSFHMNFNEMATAVSNELPIIVVVFNNNVLGMVRQWQTLFYEKRYSNTVLNRRTNFVQLAEALGAKGFRAESCEEFKEAFAKALTLSTPVIIDAVINKDESVLPMIAPGGTVEDIIIRGED